MNVNVLEVIVAIIILIYALRGLKNGLILTVCSFVILFLAVIITQVATPQLSSIIRSNEGVVTFLSEQVDHVLFESKDQEEIENETDSEAIQGLNIPKVIKKELITNNVNKTYTTLGVDNVEDYVNIYIAYSIINGITYIVVFIIAISILKIIAHALNVMSKLPVINTLNKLGGLAIGVAQGVIIIWIGFVVIATLGSTPIGVQLYEQINESVWLSFLFNNNLILNTILSVTKGIV